MKNSNYLSLLFIILFFVACKKQYVEEDDKIEKSINKSVKAIELEKLNQVQPIIGTGILMSKEEITLSFKISGVINNLRFEEGHQVNKGQNIASLNQSEINAQMASAENTYNKSVRDLERATLLYRDTVGTLEQKQNAKTAREISHANLEIVQFNKRHATINAPVKGKILKRYVEVGELVSPGQAIYTIGSSGTKNSQIIRLGIADKDIVKVTIGDQAKITFDALDNEEFKGVISKISESANPQTGLFDIEISLGDYEGNLKNGFIAKVSIQPSKVAVNYKIPMMAMIEGKQKKVKIFITRDLKTVNLQEVTVLDILDNYFTVNTEQIPKGSFVITSGAPYLKDNDSIKIVQ